MALPCAMVAGGARAAAIAAIGPNFSYPLIRAMGGAERAHANFGTRVTHAISDRVVYPVGLVIPATGAAMILALGIDLTDRASSWLDVAIVGYVGVYLYSSSSSAGSSSGSSS